MLDWVLGVLLSPLTSLRDLRELGGPVVTWIIIASLVMWTLVIERFWYFRKVLPRQAADLLGQWQARGDHESWRARNIRRAMISRLNAAMTENLPMLRVLVPLCPLLGLLGTVGGMLEVFDSMALRGSADARSMASGVSEAMVCTMTGLAVSITGMYPVFYFQARARRESELLADKFEF